MRHIAAALASLLVFATSQAHAGGKRVEPPVAGDDPPEACRTWLDDAAAAKTDRLKLEARLSLASCLLSEHLRGLELNADDASIKALDDAVAPTLAIYDQAIKTAEPAYQIIAAQAKGDVYDAMVVRMRNTGRKDLEPQLAPWSQAALAAYTVAIKIAKQHPELVPSNPVVTSAIREAEAHLAAAQPATSRP